MTSRGKLWASRPRSVATMVILLIVGLVEVAFTSRVALAATNGTIETVAGGVGTSTATNVSTMPRSAARRGGFVYVSDIVGNVVRRINTSTGAQSVIAGNGVPGFGGDNGPATKAMLHDPSGLAFDSTGNLYIADARNSVVRMVTPGGIISTVAGTPPDNTGSKAGYAGDGGPATSARLRMAQDVAFDGADNMYIADTENHAVRKVTPGGTISTLIGSCGPSACTPGIGNALNWPRGVAATSAGDVYVADTSNHRVQKRTASGVFSTVAGIALVPGFSGDNGQANLAKLNGPSGVSIDAGGRIYIADTNNNRVRIVIGTNIDTAAGSGAYGANGWSGDGGPAKAAKLTAPTDVDALVGVPLVADTYNNRVSQFTYNGNINLVEGNGFYMFSGDGSAATGAQISNPQDLAVAKDGSIVIADSHNHRIRKVDNAGTISTLAGSTAQCNNGPVPGVVYSYLCFGQSSADPGPALSAKLANPQAVAIDRTGAIIIGDTNNHKIRKVGPGGTITTIAGTGANSSTGDNGPAVNATFQEIQGLATDSKGNTYVTDYDASVVRKIDPSGQITRFAGTGTRGFNTDSGVATAVNLYFPMGLAVDYDDNVYIADSWNGRIRKVDSAGNLTTVVAAPWPQDVAVDAAGQIFFTDFNGVWKGAGIAVQRVVGDGTFPSRFAGDGGPASAAGLRRTRSLDIDDDGNLYLTDGARIRKVTGAGKPRGKAFKSVVPYRVLDSRTGTGAFGGPVGPGQSKFLTVAGTGGAGGVPASASSVVLNVTATNGTQGSFVTVFPAGDSVPTASNLNFGAGETIPNLVTVKVGINGQVGFYNKLGNVDLVADVVGYYDDGSAPGDLFSGLSPQRILDSRTGVGFSGPLVAGSNQQLPVRGAGGVPNSATAVALSVTVTQGSTGSFLKVFPSGVATPITSNLNFGPGQTISNLVITKIGTGGEVTFSNNGGNVHVVADVVGYFDPTPGGTRLHPFAPKRILDDRSGVGLSGAWGPNQTRSFVVADGTSVPTDALGVVANITATNGTTGSFLTVFPSGSPRPTASNLLFGPGQTIPTLTMVPIGTAGKVAIYNQLGSVDVIADAVGYFAAY